MVKIVSSYNNFARGQLDHDLMGRFDLPIYATGTEKFVNFLSNFVGNAKYRTGFEFVDTFEDCKFIEFRFNKEQNYICVFYNLKIRFLTYDANDNLVWVESGGSPLEVTSPYSLADCKELKIAQNADVMYIVHPSHDPRKLTRTGASSFTLATYSTTGVSFTGANSRPSIITFYKARLFYGAKNNAITTIWGSAANSYDDFSGGVNDDDSVEFTIAEVTERLEWLSAGNNSLIAGSSEGIIAINGGSIDTPITPTSINANITNSDGCNSTTPIRKDKQLFYISFNGRRIFYFGYDLMSESFTAEDANFVSYDITKEKLSELKYKKDKDDLIYSIRGDGHLIALNFNEKEKVLGWDDIETDGLVKDIATITDNDGNTQLFLLVERDGVFYIEKMTNFVDFPLRSEFFTDDESADNEAHQRYVAELLRDCNYLDNSQSHNDLKSVELTYNGSDTVTAASAIFNAGDVGKEIHVKTSTGYESGSLQITGYTDTTHVTVSGMQTPTSNTFDEWYLTFDGLTGLARFNGQTVSVVADGGYLNDFVVAGGIIDLGEQVASVVVGLKYRGLIKTFNIGFMVNTENTQIVPKNVNYIVVRLAHSAGGKVGVDMYDLADVQLFDPAGQYGLPPVPIDGDEYVKISNTTARNKAVFIVQDLPLPFNVNGVFMQVEYEPSI